MGLGLKSSLTHFFCGYIRNIHVGWSILPHSFGLFDRLLFLRQDKDKKKIPNKKIYFVWWIKKFVLYLYSQNNNNMTQVENLINLFKKSGMRETEWVQLDNLDEARLAYDENGDVVVENEHGSFFPVKDLTREEMEIFLFVIPN